MSLAAANADGTIVQCQTCRSITFVPPGQDPHVAVTCKCCPEDHHHGQNANRCSGQHACHSVADDCEPGHPGHCWPGPHAGPKEDGCTVCRPLLFLANASVNLTGGLNG